jgi:multiple sugar transport system permease protein
MAKLPARPRALAEDRLWRGITLAPALLLFAALTVLPVLMLAALSVSEVQWSGGHALWSVVGWRNFASLAGDVLLRASIRNTLIFAAVGVTLQMGIGLLLALLVSEAVRGRTLYRLIFLLPLLLPGIVIGAIWSLIYNFDFGIINLALGWLGLAPQDWLGERSLALGSVIVVDVWHWTPFCFLILLAGLEALPRDVYEAARIDGAGAWSTFRHITLPLLAPTIAVTFVFRLILAFKVFDEVYLLTGGGPGTSTEVLSFTIYRRFFTEDRAGYGAAMSLAAFALIAVLLGAVTFGARWRARRTTP